MSLRDSIMDLTSRFDTFLMAYSRGFKEVNNINFFEKFKNTKRDVEWHNWEISHLPGNYYLIGKKCHSEYLNDDKSSDG